MCIRDSWIEVVPFLRRILIHARLASILFVTEKRENALVSYDIMTVVVFLFHFTFSTRTRHREEDDKEDYKLENKNVLVFAVAYDCKFLLEQKIIAIQHTAFPSSVRRRFEHVFIFLVLRCSDDNSFASFFELLFL